MQIPNPAILRKAIEIKTELEQLEQDLHKLLVKASSQDSETLSKAVEKPLKKNLKKDFQAPKLEEEKTTLEEKDYPQLEVVGTVSSSHAHQETLLLVEDDGEEQLALTPPELLPEALPETSPEEVSEVNPQSALKESCDLPYGFDHLT